MHRAYAIAMASLMACMTACLTSCAMRDAEPPVETSASVYDDAPAAPAAQNAAAPEGAYDSKIVGGKAGYAEPREAPRRDVDDLLSALDGAPSRPSPSRAPPAPPPAPEPVAREARVDSALDGVFDDQNLAIGGSGRGGGGEGAGALGPGASFGVRKGKALDREASKERMVALRRRAAAQRASRVQAAREKASTSATLTLAEGEVTDDEAPEADEIEQVEEEALADKKPAAGRFRAEKPRRKKRGAKHESKRDEALPGKDLAPDRFAEMLTGLDETDARGRRVELAPDDPERFTPPASTLPRVFYFENTYLGGNAAYAERLRRLDAALGDAPRPYRRASLPGQPFDAPVDAGLSLTAALDRVSTERPERVYLQVGLQGSKRFGWRRPPLDVVLVVEAGLVGEPLVAAVTALMRRLGAQDRFGVVLAEDTPRVLGPLASVRDQRTVLARQIEALESDGRAGPRALAAAMREAGAALTRAADDQARIPGSGTVLVLTQSSDPTRITAATEAAHALTVQGAVTSVIELGHSGAWWPVANAGHGNAHRGDTAGLGAIVDAELDSISRVIARLLRINIRLAPGVEAIRILGSRKLDEQEVRQVKAREEATDRNLSKTMGVKADRGDDDDGIQTVIPYFYGGDAHVILVELWVTRPGPVAEVTLKYKDMVELDNATARAAVQLDRVPRPRGPIEKRVAANVRGFRLAEGLASAARLGSQGSVLDALEGLEGLAVGDDAAVLVEFERLVRQRGADSTVADALRMARDRRIGHFER